MRDLRELNINEGGRPVTTAPPTPEHLAVVERLIGTELPTAYVNFLRFSNGGHPELNSFYVEVEGEGYREEWSVNNFLSIASDSISTEHTGEVVWQYRHRWPGAPRELLPIANSGMGDLICLDLTKEGKGRVILWVHERPEWASASVPRSTDLVPVAASFEEFINSLVSPSEDS